jgi:hypothetical protein
MLTSKAAGRAIDSGIIPMVVSPEMKAALAEQRATYPPFLYKYRSGDAYHIDALRQNKVWFSKPVALNDPHDARWDLPVDLAVFWHHAIMPVISRRPDGEILFVGPGFFPEISSEETSRLRSEYEKEAAQLREQLLNGGVLCLCDEPLNHTMWTYYANGGKGFAIEYPFNAETFDMETGRWPARLMDYRSRYPDMDFGVLKREPPGVIIWKFFGYKAKRFEGEREWRSLTPRGDVLIDSPPMSAILFGADAPDSLIEQVRGAISAHDSKPELRRVVKKPRSYDFEIVSLDPL